MTTLKPREPYSPEELAKLYPSNLELQQVQIILRHGERTPVSARFKNAGLEAYWPYCHAANEMRSAIMQTDETWSTLQWRRQLETFSRSNSSSKSGSDTPTLSQTSSGTATSICQPGELTDAGRSTTLALGSRLRDLYVSKLAFLPSTLDASTASTVFLRATPIPRALESTQQAFTGLYPATSRSPNLPPPVIVQRANADETLYPNEGACKRFAELARAFADRTAQIWNPSPELAYINSKIGKWMPAESPKVQVDSHPRLSGVMDTINATLAHGPGTKLPKEFYDEQALANIDRICVEEWFAGYTESNEYRRLGIGGLVGDVTQKMVKKAQTASSDDGFKISLSGCHDTTLAATMASLGAYDVAKDKWPPYTSSIAVELFRTRSTPSSPAGTLWPTKEKRWWSSLFSASPSSSSTSTSTRKPLAEMTAAEKSTLDGYYVRLRYNDRPLTLPHCAAKVGNHLDGDETFCTLAAFKEVADEFTPRNWKMECRSHLGEPAMGAGGVEKPMGI